MPYGDAAWWAQNKRRVRSEVRKVNENLGLVVKHFSAKNRKELSRPAAMKMTMAMKNEAPVLKRGQRHFRYSQARSGKRGKPIAVYHKGNLQRSIQEMDLKGTSFIYVGPVVSRRGSGGGVFNSESRADGYYAHFVHGGYGFGSKKNPFAQRALNNQGEAVANILIDDVIDHFDKYVPRTS